MTSSRVILPAVRGRLKEYALRAILILGPRRRFPSPAARAVPDRADKAERAAAPIERVRNPRRCKFSFMECSPVSDLNRDQYTPNAKRAASKPAAPRRQ